MIRNTFGVQTGPRFYRDSIHKILEISSVVKFLYEKPDQAHWLKEWRDVTGDRTTYILRMIGHDQEKKELHARAFHRDDPEQTAQWFVRDVIAPLVLDAGLGFCFVELGPNELNDAEWGAPYTLAALLHCEALGIRALAGVYPYGNPALPEFGEPDGYHPWKPIFNQMDRMNRGEKARQTGMFQAAWAGHSYGETGTLLSGIDPINHTYAHIGRAFHLIDRHFAGKLIPYFDTEFGHADPPAGRWPDNLEQAVDQVKQIMPILEGRGLYSGFCLYYCEDTPGGIAPQNNWPPAIDQLHVELTNGNYFFRELRVPQQVLPVPAPSPSPSPLPSPIPVEHWETKGRTNYRSTPSADNPANIIGVLPANSIIELTGEISVNGQWVKVKQVRVTTTAWVHISTLRPAGPQD